MIILRPLFLLICDFLISLITKLRKLGSPSIGDLQLATQGNIVSTTFLPYDLVCTKDSFKDPTLLDKIPEVGEFYKLASVIGYKNLNKDGTPVFIKVAYFNTGELNVPEIKLHKPEDLMLVFPTLESIKFGEDLTKALDGIGKDLKPLDLEDEGEDSDNNGSGGNTIH